MLTTEPVRVEEVQLHRRGWGAWPSSTLEKSIVVDRHFFYADPDPIRISMLMPIQIRIRVGIKTMPILMRILAQFLHLLENQNFFYFLSQHCHLTMFYLSLIFSTGVLDCILKFSGKKSTL
jgi:hypothetical protein